MKRICLLISIYWCCLSAKAQDSRAVSFDKDWRFKKDSTIQAENPDYKDRDWRKLNLPHDWSIEDLPYQKKDSIQGPFTKASVGKGATAYSEGGTGWYRKTFIPRKALTRVAPDSWSDYVDWSGCEKCHYTC